MTIRFRGVPDRYRVQRVTTPRPAPPPPEKPPLPFTARPPAPPVRQRPRDWLRRELLEEQARKRARALAERATPEQVRHAMFLEGVSARALAERLHVSRSAVAETCRGRRHTPEVCAWALGVLRARGLLDGC